MVTLKSFTAGATAGTIAWAILTASFVPFLVLLWVVALAVGVTLISAIRGASK